MGSETGEDADLCEDLHRLSTERDPGRYEDFHRRLEERVRRRHEDEARLRWFRYNSPSRRRLADEYHRAGRDDSARVEDSEPWDARAAEPDDHDGRDDER